MHNHGWLNTRVSMYMCIPAAHKPLPMNNEFNMARPLLQKLSSTTPLCRRGNVLPDKWANEWWIIRSSKRPSLSPAAAPPPGRWNRTSKQFMSMDSNSVGGSCSVKRGAWVGTSFSGERPYLPTWMGVPFKNLPVFRYGQPMVRPWS
jgi:hypothetical protein